MEPHRRLVESSPDGILIVRDESIAFVNPAAVDLFGANGPDQLLGRSLLDLVDPESRGSVREHLLLWRARRAAPPLDAKIVRPDGRIRDISATGAQMAHDGDWALQLIVRDITEQKNAERFELGERKRADAALRENEERLKLAFAGAQEGVWDWNLESGAVVYSSRWKEMLGYADDEIEPHVSAWERLLHPDDVERAHRLNESVRRGASTYEGEFRLRHREGHYLHVLSRGYPVRQEPGGPVVRIVGTHFDLTERKRAETERARTEFLTHLVFAQEDERRRIAREMHDQFGEQLTALAFRIRMLKDACGDHGEWRAHVESI
jgi:PAS domain S-box-containing protein